MSKWWLQTSRRSVAGILAKPRGCGSRRRQSARRWSSSGGAAILRPARRSARWWNEPPIEPPRQHWPVVGSAGGREVSVGTDEQPARGHRVDRQLAKRDDVAPWLVCLWDAVAGDEQRQRRQVQQVVESFTAYAQIGDPVTRSKRPNPPAA